MDKTIYLKFTLANNILIYKLIFFKNFKIVSAVTFVN